jgi:hypothetical protein
MKTHKYSETVEIFAGTSWQAEMVKSLLESAEIKAYLKDDILGTITPWWGEESPDIRDLVQRVAGNARPAKAERCEQRRRVSKETDILLRVKL